MKNKTEMESIKTWTGFRFLESNEVIKKGDEFLKGNTFCPSQSEIGKTVEGSCYFIKKVRRPAKFFKLNDNIYRFLESGEIIKETDEIFISCLNIWSKYDTRVLGLTIENLNQNLIRRFVKKANKNKKEIKKEMKKETKEVKDNSKGWSFVSTEDKIDLSRIINEASQEGHNFVIVSIVGINKKFVACKKALADAFKFDCYYTSIDDKIINYNLVSSCYKTFSDWQWLKDPTEENIKKLKGYRESLKNKVRVVVQVG
jgi:hypothetical protein